MSDEYLILAEMERMQRVQRVQHIQDMYGMKADDLQTFTKREKINYNWGKAIGWGAIGTGIGGLVGFIANKIFSKNLTLSPDDNFPKATMLFTSFMGLLISGLSSLGADSVKAGKAYDEYLTEFAKNARESYERQTTQPLPSFLDQEIAHSPDRQWAGNVTNSRMVTNNEITP
jgi:hypothetical protein